jgi:hypothetical protein
MKKPYNTRMAESVIRIRESHNLESIAVENWSRSAVATHRHPPVEGWAPPSGRNCMSPSPCRLPRQSLTGVPQLRLGDKQRWEAAAWAHHLQGQHEGILKRIAKNIGEKKNSRLMTRLATRATSYVGNYVYSPRCSLHQARIHSLT